MGYGTFAGEVLRDRDLTRLGNLEQTERTLRGYFQVVNGERLNHSDMPLVKDAFWFAYERGWSDGMGNAMNIVADTRKIPV
ncbi:MAG: hypothetical protein QT00_C0002G0233 [archaeon GW2011_AR5]|nr:MAG: hypothetical protein QT00_C0002G0233 [archaeon GW2011_AR5]